MSTRPLAGIRVLDCTQIIAGPFCSLLLAQAGAQVIRVERPGGSRWSADETRPSLLDRGKLGVTLNLKDDAGTAVFKQLVAVSDVLLENYAPGAMQRLGLDYATLRPVNPRLIYASISGFGKRADLRGPYADWNAHNPTAQAMSGIMDGTGEPGGPPSKVGATIGDTIPALWTAYGIVLALEHRRSTGLGQYLDIAMYDTTTMHGYSGEGATEETRSAFQQRGGHGRNQHLRFQAGDGYVMLSGGAEGDWEGLLRFLGRADLIGQPDLLEQERYKVLAMQPVIETWSKQKTRREVCEVLATLNFSPAPVQTPAEIARCPQLEARHMFVEFDYRGKRYRHLGDPVKLSGVPEQVGAPPPLRGEHNDYIFGELLGLPPEQLREMKTNGTI